ncbi:hypothetical protein JXD38_05020 [candidate division WOR-3 bacterium]|nr:hypothetical protein [candidate division WOR-3 bacterium]
MATNTIPKPFQDIAEAVDLLVRILELTRNVNGILLKRAAAARQELLGRQGGTRTKIGFQERL